MYESTKALEIKTLIASNFVFAGDAILSCFFLFFLIISLYLLNPAVIAHIFNPTAELVIPTGTPTNKANTEIEHNQWQEKWKEEDARTCLDFCISFHDFHLLHHCSISSMI